MFSSLINCLLTVLLAIMTWVPAWSRISGQDTVLIKTWLSKAESLSIESPDSAMYYYSTAEKQCEKLKYPLGIARAKVGKAAILLGQNLQASIIVANEVLDLCSSHQLSYTQPAAEANMLLASAYEEQGRHDSSAYYYYLLSQQIETGLQVSPNFAVNLYTKLAIFWLNLYEGSNLSPEYRALLGSFVKRAKQAALQMDDPKDAISSTYFLQGAFFHGLKQYDSARYYYLIYIREREELGMLNWQRKASCFANIGYSFLEENNPREALVYLKKTKEVLQSPTARQYSDYFECFTDLMLARAYQQQGANREAVRLIESTLIRLAGISDGMNLNVAEAYNTASQAYESLGEMKQALQYGRIYHQLFDSLKNKEKLDMINGMEVRYRMVEKDKEIAESKLAVEAASQKVQKRNLLVGIVLGLLVFATALGMVWNKKNVHKQRLQQAELNSLQRNLEIERLSATITGEEMERNRIARELHDGVGGLLSAAKMNIELFEKKNPDIQKSDLIDGLKLLQQASSELRKTAHNLMPEILMQEGLSKAIQVYCASLSVGNQGPDIQVQVLGTPKQYPPHFEFSVYRIVQELVHNMVRHAKATEGLVELNYRNDGGMDLTIEDNGVGLPTTNGDQSAGGLGLNSVKQRIKAIDGQLDIKSSPGHGTSFYIEFTPPSKIVEAV